MRFRGKESIGWRERPREVIKQAIIDLTIYPSPQAQPPSREQVKSLLSTIRSPRRKKRSIVFASQRRQGGG